MVTKPTKQSIPPAPTGLQRAPTKIEPPTPASGFAGTNLGGGSGPKTVTERKPGDFKLPGQKDEFKLPEKVSQQEIKDQSFRYGGGRSAGNRSLEENRKRQEKQP